MKIHYSVATVLVVLFPLGAQVSVEDNVMDQGQSCFKITTPLATYWYQKEGCGFSSIHDQLGNDWISYQPGGGAQGEYRGIPNLGWQFHPGYTNGGTTTLESSSETKATIRSQANGWEATWDFYPTHAVLTVIAAPASYWFLYEGTPGGSMDPSSDFYYVPESSEPDGVARRQCSENFGNDLAGEWIAFGDPDAQQMLLLVHHTDDNLIDDYYPMGGVGGMTVFGFGRDNDKTTGCWDCMTRVPATFTIALVAETAESAVKTFAEAVLSGDMVDTFKRPAASVLSSIANNRFLPASRTSLSGRRAGLHRPAWTELLATPGHSEGHLH